MGDSKINTNAGDFDIQSELSTLASKNIISKKLADKLAKKLIERNIKINKQQLYLLVTKINNLLKNYKKDGVEPNTNNENMKNIYDTVESLEERIANLELGNKTDIEIPGEKKSELVQTSDIQVDENIKGPYTQEWDAKPLKNLPNDPENIIVLMKWIQYLIDKCGRDNLSNILDYYVDIGWISQDVKINLLDYSHGIKEEKTDTTTNKNITDLHSKDHIQSFVYIQKLKGKQLDNHFIDRIDGELSRITKKLDNYSFK